MRSLLFYANIVSAILNLLIFDLVSMCIAFSNICVAFLLWSTYHDEARDV